MDEQKNFSLYVHTCIVNNKKYIGITCRDPEERWGHNGRCYKDHNPYFYNAIQKYGWDEGFTHEILYYKCLSQEEAEELEIKMIEEYRTTEHEYGYNQMIGGAHNGRMSEQTKLKLSKAFKGRKISEKTRLALIEANKNRVISEETRQKMSESAKKRGGHPVSEEAKERLRQANLGKKPPETAYEALKEVICKKVDMYTKDLVFVRTFDSIEDARRYFGKESCHISEVCNHIGKNKTWNGYVWRYHGESVDDYENNGRKKAVVQYTLDGEYVATYESATKAAEAIGADRTGIKNCVNGKTKTAYGFVWKFLSQVNQEEDIV